MKINDDLYLIALPMNLGGVARVINLSLIADPENGATLVDTGLPGQEDLIRAKLEEDGFGLADLKRIILTHQDIDHVGSLAGLKEITGARVMADTVEIPYIDGSKISVKRPSPERLALMPDFKAMLDNHRNAPVDEDLRDGQRLDLAGGVIVVATPGHTLGHISLYLERSKTLITGDALTSEDGQLNGPMEQATPDMATAKASVRKLAGLDVQTIVCYHGGVVDRNANEQLRRVAADAS